MWICGRDHAAHSDCLHGVQGGSSNTVVAYNMVIQRGASQNGVSENSNKPLKQLLVLRMANYMKNSGVSAPFGIRLTQSRHLYFTLFALLMKLHSSLRLLSNQPIRTQAYTRLQPSAPLRPSQKNCPQGCKQHARFKKCSAWRFSLALQCWSGIYCV